MPDAVVEDGRQLHICLTWPCDVFKNSRVEQSLDRTTSRTITISRRKVFVHVQEPDPAIENHRQSHDKSYELRLVVQPVVTSKDQS